MPHNTLLDVASFERSAAPAGRAEGPLQLFWRRKGIVIAGLALCLALAAVYLAIATRRYTSTARLVVQQPGARLAADTQTDSSRGSANFLNTQRELLTSTPILALALESAEVRQLHALDGVEINRLARLRQLLDVKVGSHDDVLSVSAETEQPAEAPTLVNAIVNAYIAYQTEPKLSTSGKVVAGLEDKKKRAEAEVADKIALMAALEDKYGVLSSSDQDSLALRRQKDLSEAAFQSAGGFAQGTFGVRGSRQGGSPRRPSGCREGWQPRPVGKHD